MKRIVAIDVKLSLASFIKPIFRRDAKDRVDVRSELVGTTDKGSSLHGVISVSYTHLTLPTICSV